MESVDSRPGPLRRFRIAHERDVLDALRSRGPLTRQQLQAETGLSRTTLHDIVVRLREDGAVAEQRLSSSGKGRPSTVLRLREAAAHLVGLEIGRRHLGLVISNLAHEVVHEEDVIFPGPMTIPVVADLAAQTVRRAMTENALADARLASAVIGLPLSLSDGDDQATLRAHIERAFHDEHGVVPVFENNARLVALAESRWGSAEGVSDFLYAHLDNGVGGAVILDRHLLVGPAGNAGEIGHVSQDVDGLACWCGSRGCLERYLALPVLLSATGETRATDLASPDGFAVLRPRLAMLSRTLAGVLTTLDLRTIVLGGALANVDGVAAAVSHDVRLLVPSRIAADVDVRVASLGALGSARGAIALGLDSEASV